MPAVLVAVLTPTQNSPVLLQRWPKPSPALLHRPTKGWPGWVALINIGVVDPPKVVPNPSTTALDAT